MMSPTMNVGEFCNIELTRPELLMYVRTYDELDIKWISPSLCTFSENFDTEKDKMC